MVSVSFHWPAPIASSQGTLPLPCSVGIAIAEKVTSQLGRLAASGSPSPAAASSRPAARSTRGPGESKIRARAVIARYTRYGHEQSSRDTQDTGTSSHREIHTTRARAVIARYTREPSVGQQAQPLVHPRACLTPVSLV